MSFYNNSLAKATIHLIKMKFGINEIEHYKNVNGELVHFPERSPESYDQNELFEKAFSKNIVLNKSVKGFIEREIADSKEQKKVIIKTHKGYHDLLVEWIQFLELKQNTLLQIGLNDQKNQLVQYDINFWNKECFDFFNYLAENYNATVQKQKFINIWFYLEYSTPNNFVFNYPKEKYRNYVSEKFNFDFAKAKMNKPNNFDNQLVIMSDHYTEYCNKLKAHK